MTTPSDVVDAAPTVDAENETDRQVGVARLAYVLHQLIDRAAFGAEAERDQLHTVVTEVCGHAAHAAADAVTDVDAFIAALENGAYVVPEPVAGAPDPKDAHIAELEAQLAELRAAPPAPTDTVPAAGNTDPAAGTVTPTPAP